MDSSFSPNAPLDALAAVELPDDAPSWLVTFADLVLQLFAFLLIGLVITRAAGPDEKPEPAPRLAEAAPSSSLARRALSPVETPTRRADVAAAGIPAPLPLPRTAFARAERASAEPARPVAAAAPAPAVAPLPAQPSVPAPAEPAAPLAETAAPALTAPAATPDEAASHVAAAPAAPPTATPERLQAMGRYLAALVDGVAGAGAPEVAISPDEVRITLSDGIGFDSGEAALGDSARSLLAELRAIAKSMPDTAIEVSGHTDDRPIHTARFPSNLELSLARAAAVAAVIGAGDAELERRIFATGYAERRPRASNADEAGRAANRRVEVRLLALHGRRAAEG